jgi:3'-5' exoribonuclease
VEKGKYIEELKATEPFNDCVFAVKHPAFPEKDGKRRATFTLFDRTGTRKAVRWNVTDDEKALLETADVLFVSGRISGPTGQYPHQITVEAIDGCPLDIADHEHFAAPAPDDHEEFVLRFDALRGRIGNVYLAGLLAHFFDSDKFRPKFDTAVAARGHHHAFRGGLLQHTVEVAELCRAACETLPFLRHDLLVTAGLLHDIGKVYEMEHGLKAGDYTPKGTLIGHIHDGAFRVQSAAQKIEGFPTGLRDALVHTLLAHHERPEWGSAKTPALAEAIVLAQCDQISAHATEAWNSCESARGTGQVSVRSGDRIFCVADLGLDALDLAGLDAPVTRESDALTLRSLPTPKDHLLVPAGATALLSLRGLVAAGDGERSAEFPVETGEDITVTIPPGGADYLVRVEGESMIEAGILPGDLAFVRHQETARSGEIVVALVPGRGNVIKRFGLTADGPALLSENPDREAYPPLPVTVETRIQGLVTRIERDLIRR